MGSLLAALIGAGVAVSHGGPGCAAPGWLAYFEPGLVVLCRLDLELLRHEAVHAAQHCAGRTLLPPGWSWQRSTGRERSVVARHYPAEQHARELEARVIAREQSSEVVAGLVRHYCGTGSVP